MGSYFGNIQNAERTQLKFDRVFPSRKAMQESLIAGDGVFIGRFVLVEYDDNTNSRRLGYLKDDNFNKTACEIYSDSTCQFPYRLTESDPNTGYGVFPNDLFYVEIGTKFYYFRCLNETTEDGNALFKYIHNALADTTVTDYELNYKEDKVAYPNMPNHGYDSTIWRKALQNGKEIYQMIASLNSETPQFYLEGDAPTLNPVSPHFSPNSTNNKYILHTQANWGFKIKPAEEIDGELVSDADVNYSASQYNPNTDNIELIQESYPGAIYYNKKGFDTLYNNKDESIKTEISLLPTGKSGKEYYDHKKDAYSEQIDIQELKLYLPEIGNAVADLWNIVYGEGEPIASGALKRNTDIQWNSTAGLRMVVTDPNRGGYIYSPRITETLAGSINSIHDLMGMIITEIPEGTNPNFALGDALENRIYYGDLNNSGQKNFYFKDKYYILKSFEELGWTEEQINNYVGGRNYQNLIPFNRYRYYTFEDNNFYHNQDVSFSETIPYYLLGEPIQVELLQWQDIDEENGEIKYYYYIDDNNDYIKDTSSIPDLKKTYYDIDVNEVTNGSNKLLWEGTQELTVYDPETEETKYNELISALVSAGYQKESIKSVGAGYFFSKVDENGDTIILPISEAVYPNQNNGSSELNSNYSYYYLDQIALIQMQSETGEDVNIYFIIDITGSVVALSEYSALSYYQVTFYNPNKDAYYYAFSEERNGELVEGYTSLKQDANGDWIIDNSKTYVTIVSEQVTILEPEADPETGETIPTLFYTPGEFFTVTEEYVQCQDKDSFKDYLKYHILKDGVYIEINLTEEEYNNYDKTLLYILLRDYYLSTSLIKDDEKTYYRLTKIEDGGEVELERNSNGEWDIKPISENFYQPNKYYYYSASAPANKKDVLDQSEEMRKEGDDTVDEYIKDGMIYYLLNYAYVVYDKYNVLNVGSRWDKKAPAPAGVQLGLREESTQWKELPGFAKALNTIHGLILNVNKMFRFDDPYVRDDESVQGMLNQIRDITRSFEKLEPGNIVTVNDYGQLTGELSLVKVILKDFVNNEKDETDTNDITSEDTLMQALIKLENRIKALEKGV